MNVSILGAGLAGSEAALQLASEHISVNLIDSKPDFINNEVYNNSRPAELVCSNSFKSENPATGAYLLKEEMRYNGCRLLDIAERCRVPAGKSLAVDRKLFSEAVKKEICNSPEIKMFFGEKIPDMDTLSQKFPADGYIIAAGPLADKSLVKSIAGQNSFFYDAIAPLVTRDSLDESKMFWGARYNRGEADFLNVPLNEKEFNIFYNALIKADSVDLGISEEKKYFQRCMPVEEMARRGKKTLLFGPLRPVGFEIEPRPYAVLQLRTENIDRSVFNMVGFQTRLKYVEQKEVFRLVPGFEKADFLRLGSMHRNSYINTPEIVDRDFFLKKQKNITVAGQLSGVEGYNESIWSGMWAAFRFIARRKNRSITLPPFKTMTGGLMKKLSTPVYDFQPVSADFSVIFNPTRKRGREKKLFYVEDALTAYRDFSDKQLS